MKSWIVQYRPAITYAHRDSRKPFCDSSNPQEPTFDQPYVGISSMCRGEIFAPRLKEGDYVTYITTRVKRLDNKRFITALLRVLKVFDTHAIANYWFVENNLPAPMNCCPQTNNPTYIKRLKDYPQYVICESLLINLINPPELTDDNADRLSFKVAQAPNYMNTDDFVEWYILAMKGGCDDSFGQGVENHAGTRRIRKSRRLSRSRRASCSS